ncbi:hypothetical protein PAPYR_4085 [Paratrimastix pyriformis]|uniref:Uncharacterized protein n=1 Tax=Paratrimastix pyriformis TaxID=342808 RepID=A0ABQ8UKF5_9EUKA|nr:hypothetical protein PAPYR_4085 [Paratrimastix pyriformis]
MWQANLTEWYEENPEGDNLKKEENPAVGDNLKKEENPAVGDNLKKEENPAVGDNLKGQRWATSAGWGMDMMEENPKKGTTSRRRKTPASGTTSRASLGAIGWVGTDTEEENPKGDNLKKKKEENPAEGDNLMREGAEENPGFGENLDGRMEDHAGDGNASQAGDIGGILLWLRWLGLASFLLTTPLSFGSALGTGRFGRETGSDIMDASDNVRLGDLEGLACQANWNFIVDRLKRWVGMKEGGKGGGLTLTWLNF